MDERRTSDNRGIRKTPTWIDEIIHLFIQIGVFLINVSRS